MKKLMTLMLALSFMTATVAVSFAQDTAKKDDTAKKGKKKGGKKKDDTMEKKGGSR
jgi:Ni/Co efflux regulator RcnB